MPPVSVATSYVPASCRTSLSVSGASSDLSSFFSSDSTSFWDTRAPFRVTHSSWLLAGRMSQVTKRTYQEGSPLCVPLEAIQVLHPQQGLSRGWVLSIG